MLGASRELTTIIAAVQAAGSGLRRRFRDRGTLAVNLKGPADYVTAADIESEKALRSVLLGAFPEASFLAEEGEAVRGPDATTRFIVDPLDGTSNFVHGIPHFAIAVALERRGHLVAGVVYDVPKDEMFVAEAGRGAWLGSERLRVSDADQLSGALIGTGIPHMNARVPHADYLTMLAPVMREAAGIRRFSAAALDLAYVAAGRLAAFFELGLSPWDIAAGALLVREAGGRVSRPDGSEDAVGSGDVLATNGRLHERMVGLLSSGSPRRA
jgi:myo-inositol-1(or 4)-monophosphatase